jgi:hypothetical protein
MGPIIAFSSFALATLAAAPEVPAGVSLTWALPDRAVYAGEVISVSLEVTVPEPWLGENLLQLFPQPLDLPLQVSGFEGLPSGRLVPLDGQPDEGSKTVVVDGEICQATGPVLSESPNGQLASFSVRRWFTVPRAGAIQLPGAGAHYAYAASFRDDFVRGRVPVERETADALGSSAELTVLGLPEESRPLEFAGAVGAFRLSAQRAQSSVRLGDSVKVIVRVEAPGDHPGPLLETRDLQVEASEDFIELGRTLTRSGGTTSIDVSFGARSVGFHELPAASLAVFDPTLSPPAYRVARVEGPGVQVRPASDEAGPSTPAATSQDTAPEETPGPTPYWTMAVAAFVFALAVASVIRRRIL